MRNNHDLSLSQYLKIKREKMQFSEYQLAYLLNCTPQSIYDWEEGRSRPPMIFWERLIKILDLNKKCFIEKTVEFDNAKSLQRTT